MSQPSGTLRFMRHLVLAAALGGLMPAQEPTLRLASVDSEDAEDRERQLIAAFQRLGIPVKVVRLPAERALRQAAKGLLDGDTARIAGLEARYPDLVRVPVPVYRVELVAVTRAGWAPIRAWEDLRPFRIGFVRGIKVLEDHTAGMRVTACTDARQLADMLGAGRLDVVVTTRRAGMSGLWEPGLAGFRVHVPPLARFDLFLYLHRRHADLVPRLAKALQSP